MSRPRNRLLAALPEEDFGRLQPHLEPVALKRRQMLYTPRRPIEYVYFIQHGLVSVIAEDHGEKPVEVWIVGHEGLTGLPGLLGDPIATHRLMVQVAGDALRMPTDRLCEAFDESRCVRGVLLRYLRAILLQTSLIGACNSRHTLRQRLARWLLTARDLLETDDLPFTHGMLSMMLAVRRAGVTEAEAALEREGIVKHRRSCVIVHDADGLRRASCGCYAQIKAGYDQLFGSDSPFRLGSQST